MSSILTTGILQTSRLLGLSASGGIIHKVGAYTYHTFSATGTDYFTVSRYCGLEVNYLVIGGGGAGGYAYDGPGGGGGAGGTQSGTYLFNSGVYTFSVGAGGVGIANSNGLPGTASFINTGVSMIQASRGQGGTTQSNGGNSGNNYLGGEGRGSSIAGGGAGSNADGYSPEDTGDEGQGGLGSTWNGYGFGGGGGGGSDMEELKPEGGNFGGGAGANTSDPSIEGTPRTGAGGGGGNTTHQSGAAGGSGVIIIRYLTP